MQKLLQKAVNSLQNARNLEVAKVQKEVEPQESYLNDNEDYDEGCDCEAILNNLQDTEFGELYISLGDYENTEYLCDDERIFDFASGILENLNVPDDEIDNYMCGTTLNDSFLDFYEDGDGGIDITVNVPALYEFLIDIQAAY